MMIEYAIDVMKVGTACFEIITKLRDEPKMLIELEISMIPKSLVAARSNPEIT